EALVSEVIATCATVTVDHLDERITDSLGRVVTFLGVDRGALWQQARDAATVSRTHVWQRPSSGAPPVTVDNNFPYLHQRMRAGAVFCFPAPAELPPQASVERAAFDAAGIRSFAAIPLLPIERPPGALVLISLHAERPWPLHIVQQLRRLAEPF